MLTEYVTKVDGCYRVAGTRVSLDSLVFLYREGMSAEGMVECYPALTLEQVHGSLAFYLANQRDVDEYMSEGSRVDALMHQASRETNADVIARLRRSRHESQIPG